MRFSAATSSSSGNPRIVPAQSLEQIQRDTNKKLLAAEEFEDVAAEAEAEDDFVDAHQPYNESRKEWNGPRGAEPTRFGDWEQKGRCTDF